MAAKDIDQIKAAEKAIAGALSEERNLPIVLVGFFQLLYQIGTAAGLQLARGEQPQDSLEAIRKAIETYFPKAK